MVLHMEEVKVICNKGAIWAERKARWSRGEQKESYLKLGERFRENLDYLETIKTRFNDFEYIEDVLYTYQLKTPFSFKRKNLENLHDLLGVVEREGDMKLCYLNEIDELIQQLETRET